MSSSITEIKVPNKHGGSHVHDCIVLVLGLQLPMQSEHITTNIVSSNLAHG